jgi:6-phosphogluconate dehydrogenase
MKTKQREKGCDIGVVGLGVMGRNFALNLADHGFAVAGYDKDPGAVRSLGEEGKQERIRCAADLAGFIALLRVPRAILLLVPAGAPVDSAIGDLLGHVQPGDLIVDAGNSHFTDTDARSRRLESRQVRFLGLGLSGGEEGARRGPSIMPGGPTEAYERIRPLLEAAAAQVNGEPCVALLGPGSAGHFVKMVHNGIEYGLMELIAETYDLMKRGLGLNDDEIHEFFAGWNHGELEGYLMEITGLIFSKEDRKTGRRLVDEVRDVAAQLGTGMWASQAAMDLGVPVPTIDAAVAMRNLSELARERREAGAVLPRRADRVSGDSTPFLGSLEEGLHAAMIITYAQGFALLAAGSLKFGYGLDLSMVARIWRGGCIIRAAMLEDMGKAFSRRSGLSNLLVDPELAKKVLASQEGLRVAVGTAARLGLPAPGLMSALGYLDGYRSAWLPANLIQAQRDCFGSHGYQLADARGTFHAEWLVK